MKDKVQAPWWHCGALVLAVDYSPPNFVLCELIKSLSCSTHQNSDSMSLAAKSTETTIIFTCYCSHETVKKTNTRRSKLVYPESHSFPEYIWVYKQWTQARFLPDGVFTTRHHLPELFLVSKCHEALARQLPPPSSVPSIGLVSAVAFAVSKGAQRSTGLLDPCPDSSYRSLPSLDILVYQLLENVDYVTACTRSCNI